MLANLLPTSLFKQTPVVDENTRNWLIDCFAWALDNFDSNEFINNAQLVLPDNSCYPGKVSSVEEMAKNIFRNTMRYAGMQKWPITLVSNQMSQAGIPKLNLKNNNRGEFAQIPSVPSPIFIHFRVVQINQPQDLIASQVQQLATILIMQQDSLPPGGEEFIPQAIDLLSCFMGFGVIFSNTAYQFKGGCGTCNNPAANRQNALPESETVYALALFCVLKAIPAKTVKKQLKSHLRSIFNQSYKELSQFLPTTSFAAMLPTNN